MVPQEQVFFTDNSVYISNTRLVLRKGGTYPIANLSQVTFGRVAASRSWISPLIFGLIFLTGGVLLKQHSDLEDTFGPLLKGDYYLVIGGLLLLISVAIVVLQVMFPLYVVVLNGSSRPIKSKDRAYIIKVVEALNQAISERDRPGSPTVVQSTHIGQIIHDSSRHSSDIIIGQGAQANIGTSGLTGIGPSSTTNDVKRVTDSSWPVASPKAFNEGNLNTLSNQAQVNLPAGSGALGSSGTPGWGDQSRTWPGQSGQSGPGTQKIIISYSHKDDRQWLDLLRTHLAPLERQQMIAIWDDAQIATGMHTPQAMTGALQAANFAVLLVSANFLASEVVMQYELPHILQRYSQGQFTILPLILSPCLYNQSPLGAYQAFNPNNPLSMLPIPERDDMLMRVAREVQKAVLYL